VGIHGQLMYLLVFTCPEVDESCIPTEFIDLVVLGVVNTGIDVH